MRSLGTFRQKFVHLVPILNMKLRLSSFGYWRLLYFQSVSGRPLTAKRRNRSNFTEFLTISDAILKMKLRL